MKFSPSSVLLLLSSFALVPRLTTATIANTTVTDVEGGLGDIRYHYDESKTYSPCETVILMNVGTAMSVTDYDKMSAEIVKDSTAVVVVTDQNPGNFIKKDKQERFANLANALNAKLSSIVPACKRQPKNGIIVGGHSAGGQSALDAIPMLNFTVAAYMGFDPFIVPRNPPAEFHEIPSMMYGFERTTCRVKVGQASKLAYEEGNPKARVLYRFKNPRKGFGTAITHCSFTDSGCKPVCGIDETQAAHVRTMIGDTTNRFIRAVASGSIVKSAFMYASSDLGTILSVNGDTTETETVPTTVTIPRPQLVTMST